MIDVDHTTWTAREDLRAEWGRFVSTEAFRVGMDALESHIVPVTVPHESLKRAAIRNAHQAGFAAALALFRNLHLSIKVPRVEEPAPWSHYGIDQPE